MSEGPDAMVTIPVRKSGLVGKERRSFHCRVRTQMVSDVTFIGSWQTRVSSQISVMWSCCDWLTSFAYTTGQRWQLKLHCIEHKLDM